MSGFFQPSPCSQSISSMWSVNVVPNVSFSFATLVRGVVVRWTSRLAAYHRASMHM